MEKTIRNMINQQNDNLIFLTSEKNEKLSYGEFKIFNEKISRQLAATNVKIVTGLQLFCQMDL